MSDQKPPRRGFVSHKENAELKQRMAEIAEKKPYYSTEERTMLIRYHKLERNFTIAESAEVYRIHARINMKKRKESKGE